MCGRDIVAAKQHSGSIDPKAKRSPTCNWDRRELQKEAGSREQFILEFHSPNHHSGCFRACLEAILSCPGRAL